MEMGPHNGEDPPLSFEDMFLSGDEDQTSETDASAEGENEDDGNLVRSGDEEAEAPTGNPVEEPGNGKSDNNGADDSAGERLDWRNLP